MDGPQALWARQHGPNRRRGKQNEYSVQLAEKQKAKCTYGLLERQFQKMFPAAASRKGITGETLLQLCEARLDNTVYRLGIAPASGRTPAGGPSSHHRER